MNLFAYGRLQDALLMEELTGRPWRDPLPARLSGYRLVMRHYAFAVAASGHHVDGLLWRGLSEDELALLDDYEGVFDDPPCYVRQQVTVETAAGPQPAWVYVG